MRTEHKITFVCPDKLHRAIKQTAEQTHSNMSTVVRRALMETLGEQVEEE